MKVLEILTDILYYSFENKLCSFEDDVQNPEVLRIL
jgi:hypothetical protein